VFKFISNKQVILVIFEAAFNFGYFIKKQIIRGKGYFKDGKQG
jgi:hypothetical protein